MYVLLTPLVKFIRKCIRDPSGVFTISPLVKISMTSFSAFSRLSVFGWLFVYTITRTLHVTSKKCFALVAEATLTREILCLPLEHEIHIFSPLEIYVCHLSKTIHSTMKYAPYLRRSHGYKSNCLV